MEINKLKSSNMAQKLGTVAKSGTAAFV